MPEYQNPPFLATTKLQSTCHLGNLSSRPPFLRNETYIKPRFAIEIYTFWENLSTEEILDQLFYRKGPQPSTFTSSPSIQLPPSSTL